jgi:antitoxin component YwqK of YwqJK toxin-antitoxin module
MAHEIKRYHTNGKLMCRIPLVDGVKHGVEEWRYLDGRPHWRIPWVNGEKHGEE